MNDDMYDIPDDEEIQITIQDILDLENQGEQELSRSTEERPFLTTPISDFTIMEQFSLLFFVFIFLSVTHGFIRRFI